MPQKKNPDAAELVRAKTGRINGPLVALLTVMKGLPLAYSKDMQEDKEAVFDAAETLDLMIAAMTGMVGDMTVNAAAMKSAAGAGYSTATDLADWLVRKAGPAVPRRPPRDRPRRGAGRREEACRSKSFRSRTCRQSTRRSPTTSIGAFGRKSVASRTSFGGTAPGEVRKQIALAEAAGKL